MNKFQYLGRVAKWVKTLQLESDVSHFRLNLVLSWDFYNCYLAVPQPTLYHSHRNSLIKPVFMEAFSIILS